MTTDVQDRSNLSPRLTEGKAQDPAGGLGRAENTASDTEAEGAGERSDMQALFTDTEEVARTAAANVSKPHCVYRFYDQDGLLLYVGLSCRLGERIARHRATQPWWSEVADIKVEHCPSRETAEQLESRLIAESMPRHNIKGRVEWPEPECECCGNQDLIGVEWGGMFYEHLRDVTPEGKVIADESNRHFRQEGAGIELWCENCGDVVPYPRGPLT